MKKFLVILSCILLVGCSLTNTPTKKVEEFFKKYNSLDDEVLSDLELTTEGMTLKTEEEKEAYMKAMKMQYSDLKYEIVNEEVNGDEATITVKISVYDFYKVENDALEYSNTHRDEFLTDDVYDTIKFNLYRLKSMLDADERIEYTIKLDLEKKDDEWNILALDKQTLQKIHGTYDYERE